MTRSRTLSLIEALTNTVWGYTIVVALQIVAFPTISFYPTPVQSLKIGLWFTVLSVSRSYVLRRLFERLRKGE